MSSSLIYMPQLFFHPFYTYLTFKMLRGYNYYSSVLTGETGLIRYNLLLVRAIINVGESHNQLGREPYSTLERAIINVGDLKEPLNT